MIARIRSVIAASPESPMRALVAIATLPAWLIILLLARGAFQ